MLSVFKRLSPFLALLAVLVLSLPAAAQQLPLPDQPRPDPSIGRVPCVAVGTALAVLAGDATVAKIIGAPQRSTDNAAGSGRTITLDGPGAVGACGQFQGFWADGVAGPAAAQLQLLGAANAAGGPLATDTWRGQHTGPAMENRGLQAATKLDQPGTYPLVAVFSVRAGAGDDPATGVAGSTHTVRIPFTVIVRGKGLISGQVLDANGNPVDGALVRAVSQRNAILPRGGRIGLPITDPVVQGGDRPDQTTQAPLSTVTGPDGRYRIPVPTGDYLVTAAARGHMAQWYNLKDQAQEADKVKVADQQPADGINFVLKPADAPAPPNPRPLGAIQGRVVSISADGNITPIAGAAVTASGNGAQIGGGSTVGAVSDENGFYALRVPAGRWLVMAQAAGYKPQWFRGAESAANATPVDVAADAVAANIDFALLTLPQATISGQVTRVSPGGVQPVAGAIVMGVARGSAITPGGDPNMRGPTAITDEEGRYTLTVAPGGWAVGATLRGNTGGSAGTPTVWWDGKDKLEDADLLILANGDAKAEINFRLK